MKLFVPIKIIPDPHEAGQIFKLKCINLAERTITLELKSSPIPENLFGPTCDDYGNNYWPYPWPGAIGKEYMLLPNGSLLHINCEITINE